MRVSVLTATFNSGKTLRSTIESFLAQDHDDKEMLILDGASSDDTLAIAESFRAPNISIHSGKDRGLYDALNKGLGLYAGSVVGVLNSDDAYHDRTILSRVASAIADADAVHGDLDFVTNHLDKAVVRRWRADDPPATGFRSGWMPAHPTFYVRRELAELVGFFDLTYPIAADYDWMLRAIDVHGAQLARIPHVMIDMQVGGMSTNSWRAYLRHGIESLRARQRWLGAGVVDRAFVLKPARKIGQFLNRAW